MPERFEDQKSERTLIDSRAKPAKPEPGHDPKQDRREFFSTIHDIVKDVVPEISKHIKEVELGTTFKLTTNPLPSEEEQAEKVAHAAVKQAEARKIRAEAKAIETDAKIRDMDAKIEQIKKIVALIKEIQDAGGEVRFVAEELERMLKFNEDNNSDT